MGIQHTKSLVLLLHVPDQKSQDCMLENIAKLPA